VALELGIELVLDRAVGRLRGRGVVALEEHDAAALVARGEEVACRVEGDGGDDVGCRPNDELRRAGVRKQQDTPSVISSISPLSPNACANRQPPLSSTAIPVYLVYLPLSCGLYCVRARRAENNGVLGAVGGNCGVGNKVSLPSLRRVAPHLAGKGRIVMRGWAVGIKHSRSSSQSAIPHNLLAYFLTFSNLRYQGQNCRRWPLVCITPGAAGRDK
jgi:hypothetical protein